MTDTAEQLAALVGAAKIVAPAAVAERATSYWNPAPMQAQCLVMPHSTDDVAAVLRWCHANDQTVVTHGGRTGCVAGTVSSAADVVLALDKMNRVLAIDPIGNTADVEAGATLQTVQEAVAAEGLYFPLDLGARGSCTIGGNVATNAGGINVLRYGMMRQLVLGLEAVLADGTVVSSLNRMLKNNAGYDLKQLFIGTEGTLGVVTKVVVRLFPRPASRQDALLAFAAFDDVIAFLHRCQTQLGGDLSAFEIMWGDYFAAVTAEGGHRAPMDRQHSFYVVVQAEGADPDADAERFQTVLMQALDDALLVDAVVAKSAREVREIWQIREAFEAILEPKPVYLYDVSLPIPAMEQYVTRVKHNVHAAWPDGRCYTIGHIADGNLHFFVAPHQVGDHHDISNECVYEPLADYGGSVSAEHGIGLDKRHWLGHSRQPTEIELMRTLKRSLDPKNLLNPGRVVNV